MNPYSYKSIDGDINFRLKGTHKTWLHYKIDFPSAFTTHYLKSNTISGDYFRPRNEPRAPLVILLHGMGDHSTIPCKILARSLVKKGVACFILYLVIHSSRMPANVKRRFPILTPEEWFESYQISVTDVRQVIDWAGNREEIDGEKIAVLGISFGGFISAIAMGVDERIQAGVLIVTGGNSEKINRKSRLGSRIKEYRRTDAEYHYIQNSYLRYLDEVAKEGLEQVTPEKESFLNDPMTFAYRLRERPVLMINARWDESIPREATLDFWEASGKPAIMWLPTTHASIWLWYPLIRKRITNFLSTALELH